ncbi:MAG TPA: SCO1664 family protein [Jatrophihabitantaceae bacterium]
MSEEGLTPAVELPADEALELLREGELAVEGRLVEASNATLYCSVRRGDLVAACVYKPVTGERPLWDFPDGSLAERELAAHEVSVATGWCIVPPTVYRDGPYGPGMVQLWIDADETVDIVALVRRSNSAQLRRIAVFDAVINNADRKGGHLLPIRSGHIYGVDHGVTFNVDPKLRTLLWQWAGEPLTDEAVDVLSSLRAQIEGPLGDRLHELLTTREVRRTVRRIEHLLRERCHPWPDEDRPAIPWPPI